MADRVYLHVGVPKTGTTFVQDVLWRSRGPLARNGVCYPLRRRTEHFAATMDLRGSSWGGRRNPDWDGTWDRLVRTVHEADAGTGIISSELLAAADVDAVERAVRSFPDHEVHVVLTVRDLARQLASGWQEQVKHRVSVPLDDFVAGCMGLPGGSDRARRLGERFWPLHDLTDVTARWGSHVATEHLHLVTVPGVGGPVELLWERFAEVTGLDTELGRTDTARPNTSLTAPEAELLRRYNAEHAGDVSQQHYDRVVRALLSEQVLAAGDDRGPALALPATFADEVTARARATVQELADRGYPVSGDLDDLIPDPDRTRSVGTDSVAEDQVAEVGVRAVAGFVAELGPLTRRLKARQQGAAERREKAVVGNGALPAAGMRPVPGPPVELAEPGSVEPGPVYLHVGAPKTGTTFLQDVMWHHRNPLAESGVLFARRRYGDHYRASIDLRDAPAKTRKIEGTWDRVAADTTRWAGTSVISHELFAPASEGQVARALDALGRDRVHLVYTVRDMWRLLGAEWQEATKHGRALSFEEYLADVLDRGPDGVVGRWFWSVHDPVDVLARWAADLPPERVHVVTLPAVGADPALLWKRFARVVGIDSGAVDLSVARPNISLGAEEVTFLRHVNARLGGRRGEVLERGQYERYVKELLAQDVLAARPGKTRYLPPPERFDQVRGEAERIVEGLRASGCQVAGDLAELVPAGPGEPSRHPDDTTGADLAAVAIDALAGLVRATAELREAHGVGVEAAADVPSDHPVGRAFRRLRRGGAALARRVRS